MAHLPEALSAARVASQNVSRPGAALLRLGLVSALLLGPVASGRQPVAGNAGRTDEPITPIPTTIDARPDKLRLGDRLFHDTRLSRGNAVACVTCHRLEAGGDDDRAITMGLDGQPLDFNTSTIFNVGLSARLNWRGNVRTLEEQNESALLDTRLMNNDWSSLQAALRADPTYREAFAAIYGGGDIGREQILDALAGYERSLVTPNSRFDRYLRGEPDAITIDEQRGYELFKSYGCIACHQGRNVGGNLFQKFGIFADPFAGRSVVTNADLGRFAITGNAADRFVFRVPGLRNVALTAPYFHDGSAQSLDDAVDVMARNQLGRTLAKEDVALIVKFLHTLTGEFRGRPLADMARSPDQ
jgi:cytochrome c peroxidase